MAKLVDKSMISPLFETIEIQESPERTTSTKSLSWLESSRHITIMIRLSKVTLIAATALFLTLVLINHLTDYHAHFQFVKHIMSMNSVYLYNQNSWRSITSPALQHATYGLMVLLEFTTALLCWGGTYQTWQNLDRTTFHQAKFLAILGLTLNVLMWMVTLIAGQWFLMWQSELWNIQETIFQKLIVIAVILAFVSLPEHHLSRHSHPETN